jgi:hypothetical protein
MKHLRLVALAVVISAGFAVLAFAGSGKGAKNSGSGDCCGTKAAAASGSCSAHGTTAATASACPAGGKSAKASGKCSVSGTAAASGKCEMSGAAHGDCTVCADESACDGELRGLNSRSQVVTLKNGAMVVYTTETAENVRALQAALARHNEHIMNALATDSEASLCGGCKSFRGAMASGKFSRELVNVKNGAQVLLTSNDRGIVERIHALTGASTARTKS